MEHLACACMFMRHELRRKRACGGVGGRVGGSAPFFGGGLLDIWPLALFLFFPRTVCELGMQAEFSISSQ